MKTGKFILWLLSLSLVPGLFSCTEKENPDDGTDKNPPASADAAVADFTWKAEGLTVTFTNASENAVKYSWDFGDDETSTEQNPEHTYFTGGTYEVTLRATAEDGTYDTKKQEITVASAATAVFTYTAGFGSLINFDARASENVDAATAQWDFGDGETASGSLEVSHEFPGDGKYTVTLSVKDLSGNDVTPYSTEITVAGDYNLLKGSDMEADDAQYWSFTYKFEVSDPAVEMEWQFGYTQDKPAEGHNGCFALLPWDHAWTAASTRFFMYQAVDVEEGRTYKLSVAAKSSSYTGSGVAFRLYVLPHADEYLDADGHPMFKGAGVPSVEFNWFDHWGYGQNPEKPDDAPMDDPHTPKDDIFSAEYTATQTGKLYVAFDAYWLECSLDGPWLLDDFKFELLPGGPEEVPAE